MSQFKGELQELKEIVERYGINGFWSTTGNSHKFTSKTGGILNWYDTTGTLQIQGKPSARTEIQALITHITEREGTTSPQTDLSTIQPPKVFIVYGHDENSRDQLEHILTKLNIEHVILAKSNSRGKTIIEALEDHIGPKGSASIGVVLLTPDDKGYSLREGESRAKGRARQNVILEMGMLIAKLGRENTIILVKGDLERPSDTDGIIYISYKDHVKEVVKAIVDRLEGCGCSIDHKTALAVSK